MRQGRWLVRDPAPRHEGHSGLPSYRRSITDKADHVGWAAEAVAVFQKAERLLTHVNVAPSTQLTVFPMTYDRLVKAFQ
jgi:hypothetical protein